MELWIRSQDRRILQKVDNVYLNANYENKRICTIDSRDYESDLGEYTSKERALEVLDEIQRYFVLKQMLINDKDTLYKSWENFSQEEIKNLYQQIAMYEMPKE